MEGTVMDLLIQWVFVAILILATYFAFKYPLFVIPLILVSCGLLVYFWRKKNALWAAVYRNDIAEVKRCLLAGKSAVVRRQGTTLLGFAVENGGTPEMLELLIQHGANPNDYVGDGEHSSPLRSAVSRGDPAMVKVLIEHGADVNAEHVLGWAYGCLDARVGLQKSRMAECVQLLVDSGARGARDAESDAVLTAALSPRRDTHGIRQALVIGCGFEPGAFELTLVNSKRNLEDRRVVPVKAEPWTSQSEAQNQGVLLFMVFCRELGVEPGQVEYEEFVVVGNKRLFYIGHS